MKVIKIRAYGGTGNWFVHELATRYSTTVTEIPPKGFQLSCRYEVAVPWRSELHHEGLAIEAARSFLMAWGSGYKTWIEDDGTVPERPAAMSPMGMFFAGGGIPNERTMAILMEAERGHRRRHDRDELCGLCGDLVANHGTDCA